MSKEIKARCQGCGNMIGRHDPDRFLELRHSPQEPRKWWHKKCRERRR